MAVSVTVRVLIIVGFVLFAPLIGGILDGFDRKISARMQGRKGPSLLQPFYDVYKLFEKETTVINHSQTFYVIMHLIFMVFTGAMFFAGGNILLTVFALTLGTFFLIMAAFATNSPYSSMGADRELVASLSDEPILIMLSAGMYIASGSFSIETIAQSVSPILVLPGFFIAFISILPLKLKKSPFDISTSHHAHQEIVKGTTTEFSGRTLALVEIAHWYESIMLLGFVFLFFGFHSLASTIVGIVAVILVFNFLILLDNTTARVKWEAVVGYSWFIAGGLASLNLLALMFLK